MNRHLALLLILLCCCCCCPRVSGQGGTWTWMHGSTTAFPPGSYGTKGVAAATNEPPGRYAACFWTDTAGNFWLFGGVFGSPTSRAANDFWKFDVSTNMWTWMGGPNVITAPNPAGVPGTKGIPSVNNYPSARGWGSACWTGKNGDLWLYSGYGGYNDLWRYHIATNEWTWMHGTQAVSTPVYGTMGTPSASNTPGFKAEIKSGWVDSSGNLWMFGGQDSFTANTFNTMWKYSVASNEWTWVNGSNTATTAGNYGTFRVESSSNQPPSRWSNSHWKDANDNMYIFAGYTSSIPTGTLNDVWRYRPSTNKWTWVSGTNKRSDTGAYPPQKCVFYDNYYPSARFENQTVSAGDSCEMALWTFGGGITNDLWLFKTDSFKWSWIAGTNKANDSGSFGTKGVPVSTNMPPGRYGQAMWIDKNKNLWIFGGATWIAGVGGVRFSNDMWRFTPDYSCFAKGLITRLPPLLAPDTSICAGRNAAMTIGRHGPLSFTPAAGVTTNADSSVLQFAPLTTTSYTVVADRMNSCASQVDTVRFTIHVTQPDTLKILPPSPLTLCAGDTVRMTVQPSWVVQVTPSSEATYQPTGGTEILFYPVANTTYTVTVSSTAACTISPDSIRFTLTLDSLTRPINPMTDTLLCKGDTALYFAGVKIDSWRLLSGGFITAGNDSMSFRFNPPQTTKYQFIAIQKAGCGARDTLNFTIHRSTVQASFVLAPKLTDMKDPVFGLTNTSVGASRYAWYVNGAFLSNQANTSATVSDTGSHCFMLVAEDDMGCKDTAMDCARVIDPNIFLPNVFSPNGDGRNDVIRPYARDVEIQEFSVYNRYGQQVFTAHNDQVGWDGRYRGKPCDVGTYFFFIRYRVLEGAPVILKGDLMLIR